MSLTHPIVSSLKAKPVATTVRGTLLTLSTLTGTILFLTGTPEGVKNANRMLAFGSAQEKRNKAYAQVHRHQQYRNTIKMASGSRWRSEMRIPAPR